MRLLGWPALLIADMPPASRLLLFSSHLLLANLPDLVSLALYLLIRRRVLLLQQRHQEAAANLGPYGGIYVGEQAEQENGGYAVPG